jgi:hypothetical protein
MRDSEKRARNQGDQYSETGPCRGPERHVECCPGINNADSGRFRGPEAPHGTGGTLDGGTTMTNSTDSFAVEVQRTDGRCPVGEMVGQRNLKEARIPVLSCEGGCIRGEIARLAANMVSREAGFARGCHGELVTVPDSAIAQWIRGAEKVVLIDGCFLRCHGRMIQGLLKEGQLLQFDALNVYRKYTDVFDIDAVPPEEREEAARQVARHVLAQLGGGRSTPSFLNVP